MIFVGGAPLSVYSSSQGKDILVSLMENPILLAASSSFKSIPEKIVSASEEPGPESSLLPRYVYVFQREYAIVDPALVDFVGTDEATTCVGLVIRNRRSGMTSIAHLDSPDVVENGLIQMLSLVVDHNFDAELDVHLVGGFEDASPKHEKCSTRSGSHTESDGYSLPLCAKIVETLLKRLEMFHIETLFVLGHNTRRDSEGNSCPIFNGFMVETSTGSAFPACFNSSSRCPDEIVRRIRLSASFDDPRWNGKLLETYDTNNDQFKIVPCPWSHRHIDIALLMQEFSDTEVLLTCSTSPFAEGPDFVDNLRRQWDYLATYPDWLRTFPKELPRAFKRTASGGWMRVKCYSV